MLIHTAEEKDTRRKLTAAMTAQNSTRKLKHTVEPTWTTRERERELRVCILRVKYKSSKNIMHFQGRRCV